MQITNYHNSQEYFSLLTVTIFFSLLTIFSLSGNKYIFFSVPEAFTIPIDDQDDRDELNSEDELNFEFRDPFNSSDEESEGERDEELFPDAPEEEASDEDDDDIKRQLFQKSSDPG